MNRTVICLAGFPIEVEHLYPSFSASAQPYRSEQEDCLFSVHISEQDLIEERKKPKRNTVWNRNRRSRFPTVPWSQQPFTGRSPSSFRVTERSCFTAPP